MMDMPLDEGEPVTGLVFEPISHSYYIDGMRVPSVSEIIRPLTGIDKVDPYILDAAGAKGTVIHKLTEDYDRGLALDVPPRLEPYLEAWILFRKEHEFTATDIELSLGHRQHRYAGTIDRVGDLHGVRCIIDIKSGKALPSTIGLQLAAYELLHNCPDGATLDGKVNEWGSSAGRFAVQLRENGTYVLKEYSGEYDILGFMGALGVWQWRHHQKGGKW